MAIEGRPRSAERAPPAARVRVHLRERVEHPAAGAARDRLSPHGLQPVDRPHRREEEAERRSERVRSRRVWPEVPREADAARGLERGKVDAWSGLDRPRRGARLRRRGGGGGGGWRAAGAATGGGGGRRGEAGCRFAQRLDLGRAWRWLLRLVRVAPGLRRTRRLWRHRPLARLRLWRPCGLRRWRLRRHCAAASAEQPSDERRAAAREGPSEGWSRGCEEEEAEKAPAEQHI
mmetsp:Transcript_32878/g.104742  ORF Transcript_32878/g.104742 Transcript_32878/m.104742 type:complete len:233 (-) Transcript_32878:32-730(-)